VLSGMKLGAACATEIPELDDVSEVVSMAEVTRAGNAVGTALTGAARDKITSSSTIAAGALASPVGAGRIGSIPGNFGESSPRAFVVTRSERAEPVMFDSWVKAILAPRVKSTPNPMQKAESAAQLVRFLGAMLTPES
jgi:hypothetical protein